MWSLADNKNEEERKGFNSVSWRARQRGDEWYLGIPGGKEPFGIQRDWQQDSPEMGQQRWPLTVHPLSALQFTLSSPPLSFGLQ
ncbi:hypothetical protein DV515_00015122 [Chloebia gouldiae]|uniref:Uncharacterized protein n=1 Tax=Chloebia gouldiae TaxID=44316 RepID=A0A3L8RW14_CHLGU|nr:hypothetical protein DV515_00015122 [Chloebia gouldiae]